MADRILGVDPGTIRMGYGLLDAQGIHVTYLTCGVVTASRSLPLGERLWLIYQGLLEIVSRWGPTAVAIEEPFIPMASTTGGEAKGSIRSAMAIGQAEAIALLTAAAHGIPSFRYSPTQVKSAVADYGRSSKEQMQEMVRLTLGLEERPQPADAADALAVALCHLQQRRQAELAGRSTI